MTQVSDTTGLPETTLEKAACRVADELAGATPKESLPQFDWMALVTIAMQVAIEVIKNCKQNNPQDIVKVMKQPTLLARARLRVAVSRATDGTGNTTVVTHRGRLAQAMLSVASHMQDDELQQMVSEANDNSLI